ncbi:hypothetical protein C7476_10282 [Phyllobacterium bourgognense]|uniref:Uncharacterized protein n=1 Tax=Phyllobacterium bourgognense TaxID=314236 RepID=A0A368Z6L1_9HYPH|nr:hypothetical protein C7476_10282 [Phyllobacterium bourgognense]
MKSVWYLKVMASLEISDVRVAETHLTAENGPNTGPVAAISARIEHMLKIKISAHDFL